MKTVKILLQALVTVAALALPAAASAQAFPFPTSYGPYGTMFAPFAGSGLFGNAFDGTALDPNATTVHVVPPTGGTVMLYRNGDVRGWWLAPGLVSVKPDVLYNIVATRGTQMMFASGIVFRPGYTEIAWQGATVPAIAYQPAWYLMGTGAPPYGHDRYDERMAAHHDGSNDGDHREHARAEERAADRNERSGVPTANLRAKVIRPAGQGEAARVARTADVREIVERHAARAPAAQSTDKPRVARGSLVAPRTLTKPATAPKPNATAEDKQKALRMRVALARPNAS